MKDGKRDSIEPKRFTWVGENIRVWNGKYTGKYFGKYLLIFGGYIRNRNERNRAWYPAYYTYTIKDIPSSQFRNIYFCPQL